MSPFPDWRTDGQITKYSGTQLVNSLKFKLSHATVTAHDHRHSHLCYSRPLGQAWGSHGLQCHLHVHRPTLPDQHQVWKTQACPETRGDNRWCRNSAVGMCSTVARLGGLMAPWIGRYLTNPVVFEDPLPELLPLCLFGGFGVLGGLCALLLPEPLGFPLPNTFEDIEQIKKGGKSIWKCGAESKTFSKSWCYTLTQT